MAHTRIARGDRTAAAAAAAAAGRGGGEEEEEEEEIEDLSQEAEASYKDLLLSAKTTTPPLLTTSSILVSKPTTLPAKPPVTTTAVPRPIPAASSRQEIWRAALSQSLLVTHKELGEEELSPALLIALTNAFDDAAVSVLTDAATRFNDFEKLSALALAYREELAQWEEVKTDFIARATATVPALTLHPAQSDVAEEEQDLDLVNLLRNTSAALPKTCLQTVRTVEQRCDQVLQRIAACERESKLLARAFSQVAFEEDARQPKKIVKLLSNEQGEFEF